MSPAGWLAGWHGYSFECKPEGWNFTTLITWCHFVSLCLFLLPKWSVAGGREGGVRRGRSAASSSVWLWNDNCRKISWSVDSPLLTLHCRSVCLCFCSTTRLPTSVLINSLLRPLYIYSLARSLLIRLYVSILICIHLFLHFTYTFKIELIHSGFC